MGYRLRREVRDALLPGVLTAAERLLVLEIADVCNDDTREGWPGAAKLADLTDLSERSIQETLNRIGRKWLELRVPLGKSDTGKVYYSHAGKRTTFRFPPLSALEGATDRGSSGATDPGAYTEQDAMDPGGRCDGSVEKVRQIRGPSPQGTSSRSNPSSLSPREDEQPAAATLPTPRTEREIVEASPEPKNDKPTGTTGILLGAGLTLDEAGSFVGWADQLGGGPKGPGWYVTLHRNQTLQERIEEWRASGTVVTSCPECDDSGTTGDWMNPRPCDCIWWKDPDEARRRFRAAAAELGDCDHGVPGGDQTAPNGWRVCALCRGRDWVEIDLQPRTEERSPPLRRSTSALRAENALRVADELDRENGHGKYAPNARFPIKHQTFRNPPISAYEGEL